jgi:DNA-binding transcriptional ArsR family regulator
MGLTKTNNYSEQQIQLASILKVLGHPARLSILQSIIATKDCVSGDLVTEIGLAQSTVSQHLKELKAVGLIKGTIDGTSMCYCIDNAVWNELAESLNALINSGNCKDENSC